MTRRGLAAALIVALAWLCSVPAEAQTATFTIAVQTSLTGVSKAAGGAFLDAIRFAVDEANAAGTQPRFELQVFDDASTESGSRAAAQQVVASNAAIVLGPARTPLAITACRTYGDVGLPIIATTLHADELTLNPTTFRTVISTGEIGEALADYLGGVLHQKRALVFSIDNGYGRPLAARFKASAERQGIDASFRTFASSRERDNITSELGAVKDQAPIILGMEYEDAVPVLIALRRAGYHGLVMGTATMARSTFAGAFTSEREEQARPGFFTDNTYATSPMILDSANAEVLAFAARYVARFGREPSWEMVQAYDGAVLAMAALREALARHPGLATQDARQQRAAALAAIESFDAPTRAVAGLNGPLWFKADRIRRQPVRIGRFHGGVFESAPLQLLPVADPDPGEVASGAVFQTFPGEFYRLQRVVQTGTFLNVIPHVNVAKSSFGADFYLWLRYARDAGPGAADPVDIGFPDMLSGSFKPSEPAETTEMDDGTEYRLWRIQGEFRNEFDLRRFPYDRQHLQIQFFNTRASSDRIVYVLDRRSARGRPPIAPAASPSAAIGIAAAHADTSAPVQTARANDSLVSPDAFNQLTQWQPIGARERRDTLVTMSALGDLRRVGLKTPRELSGFLVTFELKRLVTATLIKMMLPVFLMTVIMYTTLHFPHALTKEKVTVEVTAVLSGAVLMSAVNSQLGGVGYTILAEYAFYGFFGLGLLCIFYVTVFETLRLGGREVAAYRMEHATRIVFLLAVVVVTGLAVALYLAGARQDA
jgi:ABC-type branched-subunit amino acid transport system substrate-binding protein